MAIPKISSLCQQSHYVLQCRTAFQIFTASFEIAQWKRRPAQNGVRPLPNTKGALTDPEKAILVRDEEEVEPVADALGEILAETHIRNGKKNARLRLIFDNGPKLTTFYAR